MLNPTGASILSEGIASLLARISGTRGVGVGDGVALGAGVEVATVALGDGTGVSTSRGVLAAHATAVVSTSAQQSRRA